MNEESRNDELTLEVLEAVGERDDLTQRDLSRRMGVALGLTNSYVRRCVRKGWIKVRQVPANRYLYYLTPKGFSEKSRLTARYLSSGLTYYRRAGTSYRRLFSTCREWGYRSAVLCGISELAEIATLHAFELDVEVFGYFDEDATGARFLRRPVWSALEDAAPADCFVLTAVDQPQRAWRRMRRELSADRVFAPDFLGLDPRTRPR